MCIENSQADLRVVVLGSFLKTLVLVIFAYLIYGKVFSMTQMLSDSMAPTLQATHFFQDVVLVDHFSLQMRPPQRGEVVRLVFKAPEKPDDFFFKRIAGLPGEKVEIKDGRVLINGKQVEEPLAFKVNRYTNEGHASPGVVLEVASDSYFVLGDNSRDSFDSRYWGALKQTDILGIGALIIWPPHRFGRLSPPQDPASMTHP